MPSSGSDGSGLKLAASLGLKASEPFPSLAPVRAASPVLKLSLIHIYNAANVSHA